MNFNLSKPKGQTFVEFLLVFSVLLLTAAGVFVMYKKAWKARYGRTGLISGAHAALVKMSGGREIQLPGGRKIKTDYVK